MVVMMSMLEVMSMSDDVNIALVKMMSMLEVVPTLQLLFCMFW